MYSNQFTLFHHFMKPDRCKPFPDLARISHQPSTATALCRTLHDFGSVRALNIVSTMPAHPPTNVCRFLQTLVGVVAKVMQGTTFRRLATKAGEKCGLAKFLSAETGQ